MFDGVQTNLEFSDLSGWRMVLCKPAHEAMTMAEFSVPEVAQDSMVLIGAKRPNEDELFLAAIGRLDVTAKPNNFDRHDNGVYWSLTPFCFAFANCPFELLLPHIPNGRSWAVCAHSWWGPGQSTSCGWCRHPKGADHYFDRVIMKPISEEFKLTI